MTPRQQKFADAYLSGMSKAQAYMKAYPKVKSSGTASACAVKLLKNAQVLEYIEQARQSVIQKAVADAEEIARFRTAVMRGEVAEKIARFGSDGEPALIDVPASVKNRLMAADALEKQLERLGAEGSDAPKIVVKLETWRACNAAGDGQAGEEKG